MEYSKTILYNGNVRLRRENFANFLEYFHSRSHEDIVAKKLSKIIAMHKHDHPEYKSPVTSEGFYFKKTIVKCKKRDGTPCIMEDLYDRDVQVKMKIKPYSFIKNNIHIAGLNIIIDEITEISQK